MLDIRTLGAVGDGQTVNTSIIQKAIDDCHSQGGGTVVIPAGTFVSGTLWLKSNVELHLEMGAILLGSPNLDDYCTVADYPQNGLSQKEQWNGAHLIVAIEQQNVAVTGPGCIDGNGHIFFEDNVIPFKPRFTWALGYRLARDKERLRPGQLCVFCECTDVRLDNLALRNASCWTVFLHGCSRVFVHGLHIENSPTACNTDGIDIDCCDSVTVSDCIINTGDDAITLRGNFSRLKDKTRACENITITNCVLSCSVCGFRIGVGDGIIRHATISNIVMRHVATGFLFQSAYWEPSIGTTISDISIANIQAHSVAYPVTITSGAKSATSQIENIHIDGFHGQCYANCHFGGSPLTRPRHITLRNCDFTVVPAPIKLAAPEDYPSTFFDIRQVDDVTFDHVHLAWQNADPTWKRAVYQTDCTLDILPTCHIAEP